MNSNQKKEDTSRVVDADGSVRPAEDNQYRFTNRFKTGARPVQQGRDGA